MKLKISPGQQGRFFSHDEVFLKYQKWLTR
jgi:hypothetical protein